MKRSQQYYIFAMCFAGMMLAALSSSYRGFFVPTYKLEFGISNTQMGLIIGFAQLASVIFSYFGGKYCLKIGPKRIVALGCILNAIAIILVTVADSWTLLIAGYCGMSSGTALLALGMNNMLPMVTILSPAIIMNFGHGIFGFGSTIYQKSLGLFLSSTYDWRLLFIGSSIVFIIIAIMVWFSPGEPSDEHKKHKSAFIYKKLSTALLFAIMFYVTAEFLVGSWIVNYFQEGYGYTPNQAAFYSTLFYGVFTFGRLFGGVVFNYVDRFKGIIISVVLASILILLGQIVGGVFLICLGLSGLFFSIVYPTTMTLINDTYGKDSAYFMGLSAIATSVGVFVSSLIFGYLNDYLGVIATYNVIPISLILSLVFFVIAYREYTQITKSGKDVLAA